MHIRARFISFAALAVFLGSVSAAHAAAEFVPIQERAQGHSLTGATLLNDSIHSNPAASTFTQVYSMEASYMLPKTFAVSILDTRTSEIGGGLGYFREQARDGTVFQGLKLSLGHRLNEIIGIGATAKASWLPSKQRVLDGDVGVLANFQAVQLGATLRNAGATAESQGLQRVAALGARLNYDQTLFLSGTVQQRLKDMRAYQYGLGVEYVSPYFFAIKGGYYTQPQTKLSAWTAGFSLLSPKMSLHYAIEFPNRKTTDMLHQLAVAILM